MSNPKSWQGNYFEDFALGMRFPCAVPRRVGEGDISLYIALTGDRTPAFCGPLGVVHPLFTFHLVLGQTVRQVSLNARANLGYAGMRWGAPLRLGDTLTSAVEVVGLKENSNRQTGIVYVRTVARNQRSEEVLSYWRWVMVKKRGADPTPALDNPTVPSLPDHVDPASLQEPAFEPLSAAATGAVWAWEDYEVGERVVHHDGQTINASDHMAFTRLFQNSAKVHFDELLTEGKPLVYGGVPVSYGYGAAYTGFENRGGIAGINAGSHANPVHTGDTVYALTEVLDAVAPRHGSPWGALRLRLVVVKNERPETLESFAVEVQDDRGRSRHHPSVALDLDYWEWMPTREAIERAG